MNTNYNSIKETSVHGRYLPPNWLLPVLKEWSQHFVMSEAGRSVKGEPIYRVEMGTGPHRILMWSQMHGNESTTTKAVLDLIRFLASGEEDAKAILSECRIILLPMLNPDGAKAYTRVNARGVDLNRDAQALTQPESKTLRQVYEACDPHFCFNLHDQRSIYNVGSSPMPATVSFLAPARDTERSVPAGRERSMKLIAAINKMLQGLIPGQVGRYDDTFNLNCVGDTFQALGTPTLLFEAGHFPDDYDREQTRKYIFLSLLTALKAIADSSFDRQEPGAYAEIPENNKLFWDILVKEPHRFHPQWEEGICLGIQFTEVLQEERIIFEPKIEEAGKLGGKFGHRVFDCRREADCGELQKNPELSRLLGF